MENKEYLLFASILLLLVISGHCSHVNTTVPRTFPAWITETLEIAFCAKSVLTIGHEMLKCQDVLHSQIYRYQIAGRYSDDVGCCFYFDFLECVESKLEPLCGRQTATSAANTLDKWKMVANCSTEQRYIYGYDTCQIILFPRQTHDLIVILFFVIIMPILFLLTMMLTITLVRLIKTPREERYVLVTLNGDKYGYKYESI